MADIQQRSTRPNATGRRLATGAAWGVVATAVMSAVMLAGMAAGVSPMPKPIPAALVGNTLGPLYKAALMPLAALAHLGYGAAAGAVLAALMRPVTITKALAYGAALWALMGLLWLPYLAWGFFGSAITIKIAAATLLLHLVYGAVLGLLLDRKPSGKAATAG